MVVFDAFIVSLRKKEEDVIVKKRTGVWGPCCFV